MLPEPIYVPILKGKEGEFAALEALDNEIKMRLTPCIEIPKVPFDYGSDRPAKSLDSHVHGIVDRIKKCWGARSFYLDISNLGVKESKEAADALQIVLRDCNEQHLTPIPVVSRSSSPECISAARVNSESKGAVACIRLFVEDFEEEIAIENELGVIVSGLGLADASSADLLVDLGDVSTEPKRASLIARSVLSLIPRVNEWRRIILAASSFPEDLSDVGASTIALLPRAEWDLWRTLQRRPAALVRTGSDLWRLPYCKSYNKRT